MSYMKARRQPRAGDRDEGPAVINLGYQRILTFECRDGGFNWWEGDNPGNAVLGARHA
jgi:hypothetical protein